MVVLTESDVPAWMALDSFAEFAQHINSDYAQATAATMSRDPHLSDTLKGVVGKLMQRTKRAPVNYQKRIVTLAATYLNAAARVMLGRTADRSPLDPAVRGALGVLMAGNLATFVDAEPLKERPEPQGAGWLCYTSALRDDAEDVRVTTHHFPEDTPFKEQLLELEEAFRVYDTYTQMAYPSSPRLTRSGRT